MSLNPDEDFSYSDTLFDVAEGSPSISLYRLRKISEVLTLFPEEPLGWVLHKAGCSEETHEKVIVILTEWMAYSKSTRNKHTTNNKKRNLGDSLAEHLSDLNGTEICLCLANFNPLIAQSLYTGMDFRVILEGYGLWSKQKTVDLVSAFESVVLGMGGTLGGGNKTTVDVKTMKKGEVISFG